VENSPFGVKEMILHFWRRRYLILVLPPVFVILAYFYVRNTMGETFRVTALVQLREEASGLRVGTRPNQMEPPVYEEILLNDFLLRQVVEDTRAKYPNYPRSGFEGLRGAFTVETITTRETAVITEFSPVLRLELLGSPPAMIHDMMNIWLTRAEELYGRLRDGEARAMREAFEKQFETLSVEVESLQGEEEAAQQTMQQASNLLMARNRTLYGGATGRIGGGDGTRGDDGLLAERVRLDLDIAEARAAETPEARNRLAGLEARLAKVDELIASTSEESTRAGASKAEQVRKIDRVREKLLARREMLSDAREIIVTTFADTARDLADNPGVFSVIAPPVVPETRVAPPRALYAIMIGGLLAAVMLALMLLEFYIRSAIREDDASR